MHYKTIILFLSALVATGNASASSYQELLASAMARDKDLTLLAIAEERAEIAYRQAVAARDAARFEFSTGQLSVLAIEPVDGASAYGVVTARPKASLALGRGPTFSVETPLTYGKDGFGSQANIDASIPLLRGPDESTIAVERARQTWRQARWKRESRRLAVEKELAETLKALASAEALVQSAVRAEAKALLALEKARLIDGASPGGSAYLALERELRVKGSERRSAEASRSRLGEALSSFTGDESPPAVGDLALPEVDLDASLPLPETVPAARDAREATRIATLAKAETKKRLTIAATVDGSLGTDPLDAIDAEIAGPAIGAGLALGYDDVKAHAGLGYRFGSGPTFGLSLDWKPLPRGGRALAEREEALALASAQAEESMQLDAARKAIRELEFQRRELQGRRLDLAEDLRFAEEQRRINAEWLEGGIVSETDYAEVLAFEEGAKARDREAALERIVWNIDRLLLAGGSDGLGIESAILAETVKE